MRNKTSDRDASLGAFADELVDLFPLLMRRLWHQERNYVTEGKLGLPHLSAMDHLRREDSTTMHDLVTALRMSRSTATGIVERLNGLGLAERSPDPRDRRVVRVALSTKGRGILRQLRTQKRRSVIRFYGQLNAEERARYLEIIRKLVKDLSPATAGGGKASS